MPEEKTEEKKLKSALESCIEDISKKPLCGVNSDGNFEFDDTVKMVDVDPVYKWEQHEGTLLAVLIVLGLFFFVIIFGL